MTVHRDLMAHLSKTKQTPLRTTKIRALQRRLQRVVARLKAGACPVRQKGMKRGQLAIGAKGSRIHQGGVGNIDLWLAFEWDLANVWKGADMYVVPGACPQGQNDDEPSPETGSVFTLLC